MDRMANNYLLICRCWRKFIYYTKNPVPHSMLVSFLIHIWQLFKIMDKKKSIENVSD